MGDVKLAEWTKKELEFLINNYYDGKKEDLKLKLDRSLETIQKKASRLRLKRNKHKSRLPIDEDFFKTWTKEMAYIFGFWIADGNMYKKDHSISFVSKDHDLLDKIKSILKSDYKISKRSDDCFQLHIYNKTIYNDLLKLGGIPRKSLTIQFPFIPGKYLSHFIRGFLDGDGSFCIKKNKYLDSNFTGNVDFLTILKNKIKETININETYFGILNKSQSNCSNRIYQLEYFGKKAIALSNYIYQNSDNLRLERKFKIWDRVLRQHSRTLDSFF